MGSFWLQLGASWGHLSWGILEPLGGLLAVWKVVCASFDQFGRHPGLILGLLGASLGGLGAILAPTWEVLGPFWLQLGGSWSQLGGSWGQLGGSWGQLGGSWGQLGRSWSHFASKFGLKLALVCNFAECQKTLTKPMVFYDFWWFGRAKLRHVEAKLGQVEPCWGQIGPS